MKKILLMLIAGMFSVSAFSQKEASAPAFSFCGKTGDCTMTLAEFQACKKELTPLEKNLVIVSFNVTVKVLPLEGTEAVFVDFSNQGNTLSAENAASLEKLIAEKRVTGDKILIEEVKASRDGQAKSRIQGMVINLK